MWPLLVAVAAVAAAQGAQYGDYAAAKMPAYGEYDAPRDAPRDYMPPSTSPDYKDEVDQKGTQKSYSKEYGNGDSWQKPSRKQSKRVRDDEDYPDILDSRNRDHGARKFRDDLDRAVKNEKPRDHRVRVKHKRDQREKARDRDDEEFSIENYIRGINENNLEVDAAHSGRKSTDRIVRRKPRDRDIGKADAVFREEDFDEDLRESKVRTRVPGPLSDAEGPLADIPSDSEEMIPRRPGGDLDLLPVEEMRRQTDPDQKRGLNEPPRLRPAQRARLEPGTDRAGDYDTDYYDLKRLQNVRKKMPGYRSRSEASEEDWAPSPVEKLRQLESRRLMNIAGKQSSSQPTTLGTTTSKATTITTATTRTTGTSTTAIITTTSEPTLTPSVKGNTQLSLAEKSRLSILKKVRMKERQKVTTTTKPPVLLQVASQLPTVVLVEASSTGDPWLRAREVRDESPENLARVRQLMRSKLVANAKDIRDLTEDWDQLVCDYVDVALLKNTAALVRLHLNVLMVSYLLLFMG